MTGWWRENRFWLPAVPVALVAALHASAYQSWRAEVHDAGPNDRVAAAAAGEDARFSEDYEDAVGPTSRTLTVRLDRLEVVDTYPFEAFEDPAPPPEGLQVVAAHLDWSAEPDQVVRSCTVALVDGDGRRYEPLPGTIQDLCVNYGQEGPSDPVNADTERGQLDPGSEPRPPQWSTAPRFLVPEGREITRVLVWWTLPRYAELSVS